MDLGAVKCNYALSIPRSSPKSQSQNLLMPLILYGCAHGQVKIAFMGELFTEKIASLW